MSKPGFLVVTIDVPPSRQDDEFAVFDDRLWFQENPHRSFRLRKRFRREMEGLRPWHHRDWVAVRKIDESNRMRVAVRIRRMPPAQDLLDDDGFCAEVFHHALEAMSATRPTHAGTTAVH